jgi:serine/threonine protein kinase
MDYSGMPRLGNYAIRREIARSNDIVYEAVDMKMGRRVAVKELNFGATPDAQKRERIERFYREARAAGSLNHPNILTVHEVGEDHGRYFIAMEFLEGQSLRDRLKTAGALPISEAIIIVSAVCDALDYAHQRGVIHRDIKPDNVHLLPGGVVKLTDFGIARILHEDQLTVAGQIFGTPSYMSPEQIKGLPLDARADIFSLGIMLFEMLTGRKPYTGDSVVTITHKILGEPLPPLPGVAPEIDDAIRLATHKDLAQRTATARAFKASLQFPQNKTVYPMAMPQHRTAPPPMAGGTMPNANSTVMYGNQTSYGMAAPPQNPTTAPPIATPQPQNAPQQNIPNLALIIGGAVVAVGIISALVSLAVINMNQANIKPNSTGITSPQMTISNPNFTSSTSVSPQESGVSAENGKSHTYVPGVNLDAVQNAIKNSAPMLPSHDNRTEVVGPSQVDMTPQALEAKTIFDQASRYELKSDIHSAITLYEKASNLAPGSKISHDAGTKSLNLQMNKTD